MFISPFWNHIVRCDEIQCVMAPMFEFRNIKESPSALMWKTSNAHVKNPSDLSLTVVFFVYVFKICLDLLHHASLSVIEQCNNISCAL